MSSYMYKTYKHQLGHHLKPDKRQEAITKASLH